MIGNIIKKKKISLNFEKVLIKLLYIEKKKALSAKASKFSAQLPKIRIKDRD